MINALRIIGSIIAGFVLAFALVIALELFSSVVHPLPADFAGTAKEMCRHVGQLSGLGAGGGRRRMDEQRG